MQLCQSHWDELRNAINERGLNKFVSQTPEDVRSKLQNQLDGDESEKSFDPLMDANFAIWSNALEAFGIEMLRDDAPCPLCLLDDHATKCTNPKCSHHSGHDWIRFAADAQYHRAVNLGLIPKQ